MSGVWGRGNIGFLERVMKGKPEINDIWRKSYIEPDYIDFKILVDRPDIKYGAGYYEMEVVYVSPTCSTSLRVGSVVDWFMDPTSDCFNFIRKEYITTPACFSNFANIELDIPDPGEGADFKCICSMEQVLRYGCNCGGR